MLNNVKPPRDTPPAQIQNKMENIEFENAKKAMIKKIEFQKIRVELEKIGLVKVKGDKSADMVDRQYVLGLFT